MKDDDDGQKREELYSSNLWLTGAPTMGCSAPIQALLRHTLYSVPPTQENRMLTSISTSHRFYLFNLVHGLGIPREDVTPL